MTNELFFVITIFMFLQICVKPSLRYNDYQSEGEVLLFRKLNHVTYDFMLDFIHENLTYNRRINTLATQIAEHIMADSEVLDIGCGDGQISELIVEKVEGASIAGIDVMSRSVANINVTQYDGLTIPLEDNSVDTCVFVDVLHHAEEPFRVMQEAGRVARKSIIIKDHLADGFLSWQVLRFMDWVGNERHGVSLPYNYFKKHEWLGYFTQLGWEVGSWKTDLKIYDIWCSWAFDRKLHFIAKLEVPSTQRVFS